MVQPRLAPTVSWSSLPLWEQQADAIVVPVVAGSTCAEPADFARCSSDQWVEELHADLVRISATGRDLQTHAVATPTAFAAPVAVTASLDSWDDLDAGVSQARLREAFGAAARVVRDRRRLAVLVGRADRLTEGQLQAVVEGILLGSYIYAGRRSEDAPAVTLVAFDAPTAEQQRVVQTAAVVAAAVNRCRDVVNAPANLMRPSDVVQRAVSLRERPGVDVQVWDRAALIREGFGGIEAVGRGSDDPPALVRIAYASASATRTLHLVGKGVTFDSGGIDLKPSQSMVRMKFDLASAAAVLETVTAVSELQPDANVVGWLPLAEHLPSGSAMRPSDVLTMFDGSTVEITDTDGEGRLLLADAVARAAQEKPDVLVDLGTLTAAQTQALGPRIAGVMGTPSVVERMMCAAQDAGEGLWPIPLPQHLTDGLRSDVADQRNVPDNFDGAMAVAGLFIGRFVSEGIPWAHVDMAGPGYNAGKPHGCTPSGGTGAMVRTLVRMAMDLPLDRESAAVGVPRLVID